jgi:UDP-glucose 4-epimerase
MHVLVTGGAGYIGSHTIIALYAAGHSVTVVDDLSNSSEEAIRRVREITGQDFTFYNIDCADKPAMNKVFKDHPADAVIHFAGLKAVGESVAKPLEYYRANLDSTLTLCELMLEHGVKNLVFSSSATVYGPPSELPLTESSRVGVGLTNPYGKSKYMIEEILADLAHAKPELNITLLRYFNPIGAHESGRIGEDPADIPNNLLPFVSQVAVGKLPELSIYGNDYDTPDGTGVRDYIHVVDLAEGHVAALQHMDDHIEAGKSGKPKVYNLGTGKGVSVLEVVEAYKKASGKDIPYGFKPRRPGDIAACYADCSKANAELGWKAERSLEQACTDSWRWQSQNPDGYK